jgi:hypothetical protein
LAIFRFSDFQIFRFFVRCPIRDQADVLSYL